MENFFKNIKNSTLESFEYSGIFCLKFNLNYNSNYFNLFQNFNIDFISEVFLNNKDILNIKFKRLCGLIGKDIEEIYVDEDKSLVVVIDKVFISSKFVENELVDVSWELYSNDKKFSILCNDYEIYCSEELKKLSY